MGLRTKVIIGSVIVLGALGGVAVVRSKASGSADGTTKTVAVTRGEIVDKALAVGTIEPEVEIEVKSQISGVVRGRFADVGDFVRAGEPLLEIKPNPTPLELAEARRQVELRRLELDNLRRDVARLSTLRGQGLVSDQEYEGTERRLAGLAFATGVILGVDSIPTDDNPAMQYIANPKLSWPIVLACVGTLIGIGAAAGILPARRAAAVDPVESLRYE